MLYTSLSAQFNTIGDRHTMCKAVAQKQNDHPVRNEMVSNKLDPVADKNVHVQQYMSVSYPLDKIVITSPYGRRKDPVTGKGTQMHKGIDLRAHNENVYAMLPGEVTKVGYERKGGNYITIKHGNYTMTYCHLSKIIAKKGDQVLAGDVVAISGNTGSHTTAPHLHIGLKYRGKHIDAMILLNFIRQTREQSLAQLI